MKGLLMEKLMFQKTALFFAVFALLCFAGNVSAKAEWKTLKNISLADTPKDIVVSKDGATAYVLCEKSIQVVSTKSGKTTSSVPVNENFTKIALSADGETVYLTDSKNKQVTVMQFSQIYDIEIGNSAVIGKKDAKVNLVAFLDYQ
jgi:DNA-binding beta-propeller fold protein YncE